MSFPTIPFRLLTVAILFAGLPVHGQGTDTKKAAKVEFRVTRFDIEDRESPVFRAGSGDRQVEIEVPLTFIAGPFEAPLRDGTTLDLWQGAAEKPVISLEIVRLPVFVSLEKEDKWKLASTEQWPCDPRFRKYLVAYMSPRTRQLVFHSVMERM
jgi:hypothetical protein